MNDTYFKLCLLLQFLSTLELQQTHYIIIIGANVYSRVRRGGASGVFGGPTAPPLLPADQN